MLLQEGVGEGDAESARLQSRHDDAGGREYEGEDEEVNQVAPLETQLSDLDEDADDEELSQPIIDDNTESNHNLSSRKSIGKTFAFMQLL